MDDQSLGIVTAMRRLLALAIVTLTCASGCHKSAPRTKPTLEEQARCASRAEKVLKSYDDDNTASTQTNHFSPKLGICAVRIRETAPRGVAIVVMNAYESTRLGLFIDNTDPDSIECYVGQTATSCNDESDFDRMMKPYME